MPRIFTEEQLGKDRVNGFYETPLKTVEYICNKILPTYKKGMKVLDPAVGDGVFLYALEKAGVDVDDLYGFDTDPEKVATLQKRYPNVQLFDATLEYPIQFDFVVGNPPYNGDESHFIRNNRDRLKRDFKEIGARNTYTMISYRSINALKAGGVFSMILSDSFLTNSYYKEFRLFLLKNTSIEELLLAPWKLFHGRSADVRTCILTATKKEETDIVFDGDLHNEVRLIDRVKSEDEYDTPSRIEKVEQNDFFNYPNSTFLIGVPKSIREIYLSPPARLGEIALGGTGISTGNDKRFLRRKSEVEGDTNWVPYFKNGARKAYWYEPEFHIERDYKKNSTHVSNYMVRNEPFFFKEGISCSSVGVRFSAAYLPPDCLFGVNANFFFHDEATLHYTLGLLNSKLAWYFARKVLIRTNNISANYLRLMPYIEPAKNNKFEIASRVNDFVKALAKDQTIDSAILSSSLDAEFYEIYKLSQSSINEIEQFCNNFYHEL